jgi:hypothetical protein
VSGQGLGEFEEKDLENLETVDVGAVHLNKVD